MGCQMCTREGVWVTSSCVQGGLMGYHKLYQREGGWVTRSFVQGRIGGLSEVVSKGGWVAYEKFCPRKGG